MPHEQMGLDLLHGVKSYTNHNQGTCSSEKEDVRRDPGHCSYHKGQDSYNRQENGSRQCDSGENPIHVVCSGLALTEARNETPFFFMFVATSPGLKVTAV